MCMFSNGARLAMNYAPRKDRSATLGNGAQRGRFASFAEGVNATSRENAAMRSELAALKTTLTGRSGSTPAAPGAPAPLAAGNFGVSAPATDLGNLFVGSKTQLSAGVERVIK